MLDRLRAGAVTAFAGEPVRFAYLFGSQAAGTATPGSDVDVAVMLADGVPRDEYLSRSLRLAGALETASGVGPIEALVVLNDAPLPLAGRVRAHRVVIFSEDEPGRVRYESRITRLFHDFQVHAVPRDLERLRAIAAARPATATPSSSYAFSNTLGDGPRRSTGPTTTRPSDG